jgi:hypothetical protein
MDDQVEEIKEDMFYGSPDNLLKKGYSNYQK